MGTPRQSFRHIAAELERRIRDGIYPPDSALPPRTTLMAEFQVARATLDRAVRTLVRTGKLTSRRGSGTFVSPDRERLPRVALVGGADPTACRGSGFDLQILPGEEFERRSSWNALFDYDGVLWLRPERRLFPAIEALRGERPQVVINRVIPTVPFVSVDHYAAYREITAERLREHPRARVVFLRAEHQSEVTGYRFEGFMEACREADSFYRILTMPARFEEKLALLEEKLPLPCADREPLLIVSDSLAHTGSVIRWGTIHGAAWGQNVLYSDFDDDFDRNVWGVEVTSFLQDHDRLFLEAAAKLGRLLRGEPGAETGERIFPRRRNGET